MNSTLTHNEAQLILLIAGYLVLAGLVGVALRRQAKQDPPPELAGKQLLLWGAVGLALVLRLILPDATLFHENGHGVRYIGMAIQPDSDLHVYGSGYQAFFHTLFYLLPPTTGAVIGTQIVLGSLSCWFIGRFVTRLSGSSAGLMCAYVLATLPIHIRLSATESPFILAIFLSVVALWAVSELVERPGWIWAVIAGMAGAMAAQTRPLMLAVPIFVILVLALMKQPQKKLFRTRYFAALLLTMTLFLVGHILWMTGLHTGGGYGQFFELTPERVLSTMGLRGLLLEPDATPPALLLLALIGFAASWKENRRVFWLLLVGFLGITWLYGARANHFTEALRFALVPQVFLALLAGVGAAWVVKVVGAKARHPKLIIASLAVVLLAGAGSASVIRADTVDTVDYAFMQKAFEVMPDGCRLVIADRRMGKNQIESAFPYWEYAHRKNAPAEPLVVSEAVNAFKQSKGCMLYARLLPCLTFIEGEPQGNGIRAECRRFEADVNLEPLLTETVDARSLPRHLHFHPESLQFGVFRVTGLKP